ncbi:mannose-1-phosphate guanylyltransferase [Clostridium estertheticum]|uniref:mannose-1-phosphate guanylyltransferase n=1 Tax=Clostridium estertheticum TaxID=238834 RepID=A0AA47ELS3_9CLOT|nr:mannose-1-phosphate guanylyltransferase [Clostridium estertheticum]MBU3157944.1 mannose-1-phosphate guanylyltransferase [Clostridium estertheticum]WAG62522.1 mannose-1-phosphate guanylyltransferase [Clostridium estertheticum]
MLCALIMAGGKGTRFWPLSTEEKPKQFLKLLGEDTMLQMSVKRLEKLIPIERIFIVTGTRYMDLVREQIPNLPLQNIIVEPVGKNTAPCIALSAFHIDKIYEDATIAVLPSDHLIKNEASFLEVLNCADEFVNENTEAIVTIGMKPDRAETGYGYINYGDMNCDLNGNELREVKNFVEKPDSHKANEYLKDGNYLWNGGMFIWKATNILKLTKQYLLNTFEVLSEIAATREEDYHKVLQEKYINIDSISVDFGIMEKAKDIYVIPADFGWDDVGSWEAIERYREKDNNNNVCMGNVKKFDCSNNIIISNGKPIVISGLQDTFVLESDDMIFIGKKDGMESISELKNRIS